MGSVHGLLLVFMLMGAVLYGAECSFMPVCEMRLRLVRIDLINVSDNCGKFPSVHCLTYSLDRSPEHALYVEISCDQLSDTSRHLTVSGYGLKIEILEERLSSQGEKRMFIPDVIAVSARNSSSSQCADEGSSFMNSGWVAELPWHPATSRLLITATAQNSEFEIASRHMIVAACNAMSSLPEGQYLDSLKDNVPDTSLANETKIEDIIRHGFLWVAIHRQQNHSRFSVDEFATDLYIKNPIINKDNLAEVCSGQENMAGPLSFHLLDRTVLVTKFGLMEVANVTNLAYGYGGSQTICIEHCVTSILSSFTAGDCLTVIASVRFGSQIKMVEFCTGTGRPCFAYDLIDANGSSMLDWFTNLDLEDFTIVAAAIETTGMQDSSSDNAFSVDFVFLTFIASNASYALVSFKDQSWSFVSYVPSDVDLSSSFSITNNVNQQLVNPTGIFIGRFGEYFLFGNVLMICFPQSSKWFLLSWHQTDPIQSMTMSPNGLFAFVTSLGKIWLGGSGLSSVRPIFQSEPGAVIFFDSFGKLFQIKSSFLPRELIDIQDLLLKQNWEFQEAYSLNRLASMTVSAPYDDVLDSKRLCPFEDVEVCIQNVTSFTRIKPVRSCRLSHLESLLVDIHILHDIQFSECTSSVDSAERLCCLVSALPSPCYHSLPNKIFIQNNDCFLFNLTVYSDQYKGPANLPSWHKKDDVQLLARVSSPDVMRVTQQKIFTSRDGIIVYQVGICAAALQSTQVRPGERIASSTVELKVPGASLDCLLRSNVEGQTVIKGLFSTVVDVGCPPGLSVSFDEEQSKLNVGKEHYCTGSHGDESVPCFLFDREFKPQFWLVDGVTSSREAFPGRFTLTIIAGGPTQQSIVSYSPAEQIAFNVEAGSSLIWLPVMAQGSTAVAFDSSNVALRWLCRSQSPCAGVAPEFPDTPKFYVVIEFSNRDVDNSTCDLTFRFTILVHGLSPGSINPSLIIVLVCVVILIMLLVICYALRPKLESLSRACAESMRHLQQALRHRISPLFATAKREHTKEADLSETDAPRVASPQKQA